MSADGLALLGAKASVSTVVIIWGMYIWGQHLMDQNCEETRIKDCW